MLCDTAVNNKDHFCNEPSLNTSTWQVYFDSCVFFTKCLLIVCNMSVGNKITNVILSHSGQVLTNTWGQCRCSKMQLLQNTANTDSISQIMQDWFCLRFHFLLQPVGGKKIPINEQTLRCDVFTRERLATKHGWFRQECWFLNRIDLPAVSDGSWKWCAVMCVREDKGMHCFVDNSDLYRKPCVGRDCLDRWNQALREIFFKGIGQVSLGL